jgi:hypothetical protein
MVTVNTDRLLALCQDLEVRRAAHSRDASENSAVKLLAAVSQAVDDGRDEWPFLLRSDLYLNTISAAADAFLSATSPAHESAAWRAAWRAASMALELLLMPAADLPAARSHSSMRVRCQALASILDVAGRVVALEVGAAPGAAAAPRSMTGTFVAVTTGVRAVQKMASTFPDPLMQQGDDPADADACLAPVMSSLGKLARRLAAVPPAWEAQLAAQDPVWRQKRQFVLKVLGQAVQTVQEWHTNVWSVAAVGVAATARALRTEQARLMVAPAQLTRDQW